MLNLDRNQAVQFTQEQQQEIDDLFNNYPDKSGIQLWAVNGSGDKYKKIKTHIRAHYLEVQELKCVYCEDLLDRGGCHIEHFAPKGKHKHFLYEPLNLTCACPICNGFAKKGEKETIEGSEVIPYENNHFKYVHPFLDNVDDEIKYKDELKTLIDRDNSTERGRATIDLFNWDSDISTIKRVRNLQVKTTKEERRIMISEILNFED